eukprot:XP_001699507.1 predicted protein [Chlamydomonas reinhardtii]
MTSSLIFRKITLGYVYLLAACIALGEQVGSQSLHDTRANSTQNSSAARVWLDSAFFSDGELQILKDIAEQSAGALVISGETRSSFLSIKGAYVPTKWDLYWTVRRACHSVLGAIAPPKRVNCVPGVESVAHKQPLEAYGEAAFAYIPRSYMLPGQYWTWRAWTQHALSPADLPWVLKANEHRGRGVSVMRQAQGASAAAAGGGSRYEMHKVNYWTIAGEKMQPWTVAKLRAHASIGMVLASATKRMRASMRGLASLEGCGFEVLGVDFLLNSTFHPTLSRLQKIRMGLGFVQESIGAGAVNLDLVKSIKYMTTKPYILAATRLPYARVDAILASYQVTLYRYHTGIHDQLSSLEMSRKDYAALKRLLAKTPKVVEQADLEHEAEICEKLYSLPKQLCRLDTIENTEKVVPGFGLALVNAISAAARGSSNNNLLGAVCDATAVVEASDGSRILAIALLRGDLFTVLARCCAAVGRGSEPGGASDSGSSGSTGAGSDGSDGGRSSLSVALNKLVAYFDIYEFVMMHLGQDIEKAVWAELYCALRRSSFLEHAAAALLRTAADLNSMQQPAAHAAELRELVSGPGLRALLLACLSWGSLGGGGAVLLNMGWPAKAATTTDVAGNDIPLLSLQVATRVFQATVSGRRGAVPVAQPPRGYVNTGSQGCALWPQQQPQPQQVPEEEGKQQRAADELRLQSAGACAAVAVYFEQGDHPASVEDAAISGEDWARTVPAVRLLVRLLPEVGTRGAVRRLPRLWQLLVAVMPQLLEPALAEEDATGLLTDVGLLLRLQLDWRGRLLPLAPLQPMPVAADTAAAQPFGHCPSLSLRLALEAGLLPALERLLRAAFVEQPAAAGGGQAGRQEVLERRARIATCAVGCLLLTSGVFPALLAHAPVAELVPLLATLARVLRRLAAAGDALLLQELPLFGSVVPTSATSKLPPVHLWVQLLTALAQQVRVLSEWEASAPPRPQPPAIHLWVDSFRVDAVASAAVHYMEAAKEEWRLHSASDSQLHVRRLCEAAAKLLASKAVLAAKEAEAREEAERGGASSGASASSAAADSAAGAGIATESSGCGGSGGGFRRPTVGELLASTGTALLDLIEQDMLCAALAWREQRGAALGSGGSVAGVGPFIEQHFIPFLLLHLYTNTHEHGYVDSSTSPVLRAPTTIPCGLRAQTEEQAEVVDVNGKGAAVAHSKITK